MISKAWALLLFCGKIPGSFLGIAKILWHDVVVFLWRPSPNITHTVDGRSPAPVDMVNIPLFTGFYTFQGWSPDFFHQQYGTILWPKSKKLQPAMFVSIVDQQLLLHQTPRFPDLGDMPKFATEIHGGRSFQIIGTLDLLQTVGKKHKISSNWWFNGDLWW